MSGFLQLCLQVPNLGTLLFFVVFVLAVPGLIIGTDNYDFFKYYFPFVVMLAATLTESGAPRYFDTLYPIQVNNLSSFLSKNFINLLAIVAILISGITASMAEGNLITGLISAVIAFMITFPVAGSVIPFLIRQSDRIIKDAVRDGFRFPGNWHKYFIGLVFIVMFMILQLVLTRLLTKMIISSNLANNAARNAATGANNQAAATATPATSPGNGRNTLATGARNAARNA
jgi:hypothetical protein